jgi:hypothetical protein
VPREELRGSSQYQSKRNPGLRPLCLACVPHRSCTVISIAAACIRQDAATSASCLLPLLNHMLWVLQVVPVQALLWCGARTLTSLRQLLLGKASKTQTKLRASQESARPTSRRECCCVGQSPESTSPNTPNARTATSQSPSDRTPSSNASCLTLATFRLAGARPSQEWVG